MKLATPRRVLSLGLLFSVALAACSSKTPTGWTTTNFYSQPDLVSYQPSQMRHSHSHSADGACPIEDVGTIAVANRSKHTEFVGTLDLSLPLEQSGVSLSHSHVEIAPNSSVQVTVRFQCVQSGQFSGNVLLIHDESLERINGLTEEEKAQFVATSLQVPTVDDAQKNITAIHISVP